MLSNKLVCSIRNDALQFVVLARQGVLIVSISDLNCAFSMPWGGKLISLHPLVPAWWDRRAHLLSVATLVGGRWCNRLLRAKNKGQLQRLLKQSSRGLAARGRAQITVGNDRKGWDVSLWRCMIRQLRRQQSVRGSVVHC